MQTCTQCGATSPLDAQWCNSCYLLFSPRAGASADGAIVGALPPVGPDVVIPAQEPSLAAAPQNATAAAPVTSIPFVPDQPTAPPPPPPVWAAPAPPPPPPGWAPDPSWAPPAGAAPPVMPTPGTPTHPGWAPPVGWAPPGGAMAAPAPGADGRLLSGRAIVLVAVSIGLGGIYQLVARWLADDPHLSLTAWIRWNLILVLAMYAIVGTVVVSQITPKVRLRWGEGSWLVRVAYGASFGLLGGGLAVAAQSAAQHRLATDPRGTQIMGEGDIGHILIALLLLTVAAPLVEETLFRGLLLESLRRYGPQTAIIGSALCFAIWHFNKAAIIYYTLMGCVFAAIYLKRGLLSSMSAHAAFNGVLTVVAIVIVLGPAHTFQVGALKITEPGGWTQEKTALDSPGAYLLGPQPLLLDGPDGAGFGMFDLGPAPSTITPDEIAARLQSTDIPLPAGSSFDPGSVQEATLPTVGTAVEASFTLHANSGRLAFFSYGGDEYLIFAVTSSSSRAESDYSKMLNSLQPAGSAAPAV